MDQTFPKASSKDNFKDSRFFVIMAAPTIMIAIFTALVPLSLIVYDSFKTKEGFFTLVQYLKIFGDTYFLSSLGYTLMLAFLVTVICIVISFPLSYILARNEKIRNVMLGIISVPKMLPFFVIGYSLILLLAPYTGLINDALVKQFHILKQPLFLLFNGPDLVIALTYITSVMAVAMLTGIIQAIEPNLESAAESMGASRFTTFIRIILPLSTPGTIAVSALVFSEVVASFSVPLMLSGKGLPMVSLLIRNQLLFMEDWNYAFAQAIVVAIFAVGCTVITKWALERGK
jgi:ABC-type spermidine/putrescine transport system permease subunit I